MLEPYGLILIGIVLLILFAPKRLPDLGRSFGKTMKAFRENIKSDSIVEAEHAQGPSKSVKAETGAKHS
ncbi:MAG: twin-arginine translocase TatA/TatE family subunit [Coriobacteriia bacterium]|nr:twin-arginine translocase TatA/TatE family subunit [Coriobacteriia bacterium]